MIIINEWICGAMVARLTPDQKVACSIHVRFRFIFFELFNFYFIFFNFFETKQNKTLHIYHPSPKSVFSFFSLYFPLTPHLFSIFTIQVPNPPKITKPQMFLSSFLTSQSHSKTTKPNVPKSLLSLSPTLLLLIHPSFLTILHPHPHLHTTMSSTTQSFSSGQTHDPNFLRFDPTQEKPGSNARQVRG